MDVKVYTDILRDIKSINRMNVNDTYFNIISKKYPNISEETLRSIISLWFQRKVTHTAHRVKEIKMYDLYQKLLASGIKDACWQIANQLDYPPSLVAKIVLSSYLAELKSKENPINPAELKTLRKQQCPYCRSLLNDSSKADKSVENEVAYVKSLAVKKHRDPRVELAINLFDENDEIGKYFLEKFTFTNNNLKKHSFIGDKSEQNKSNKFFWQASSFEEMGERNVKKFTNVEKLFNDRLGGSGFAARFGNAESTSKISPDKTFHNGLEGSERDIIICMNRMALMDANSSTDLNDKVSLKSEAKNNVNMNEHSFSPKNFNDTPKVICNDNSNSTFDEILDESREGANMKICTCGSTSLSENSDSDSDDSDEAYENFSIKELFENPSLIDNPVLARDIFHCTTFDDQYGPTTDVMCSSSGVTHEKLLEEYVKNVGLAYKTENNLRGDGFDKTPDIILLVPVAVKNFVINWIESKAQFADYKLHQDFEKRQFQNYVNRFGPGLVIYWHGYVSDILKSDLVNKQIIISDRFPSKENFTFVKSDKFKSWILRGNNPDL